MDTYKLTKIVATIGPASDSPETIAEMIKNGANVFRFNMKHSTVDWHHERINRVQKVADDLGVPVGILIDLQGPEIRLETRDKKDIPVAKNEPIVFADAFTSESVKVIIPHDVVFDVLEPGDLLLVDDGFLEFTVIEKRRGSIVAESHGDYIIKHRKGVNLPGKHINLPSLIDDDLLKLDMAGKTKVDFVALSFSRTKKDIEILRDEMKHRNVNADIVAKIESKPAIEHLDELIKSADAIMVARGDLGIEVPIEQLAYWQREIINRCRNARKPVITATQMLQSMIENPRPTRAEATDVSNAVFNGTDAVMLSAESASGKYPVKAIKQMAIICRFSEQHSMTPYLDIESKNNTELVDNAAITIINRATNPAIDAMVVFTERGYTAKVLSASRPRVPIIAISRHQQVVEKLTLSYGVQAFCMPFPSGEFSMPHEVIAMLKEKAIIASGDTILVIHGKDWRKAGLTNALTIMEVE